MRFRTYNWHGSSLLWQTAHPVSDHTETPDLFADSLNVSSGPYGFTLTLFLSDPPAPGQTTPDGDLGRVVGRVRLAPDLVEDLVTLLTSALQNTKDSVAARKAAAAEQAVHATKEPK